MKTTTIIAAVSLPVLVVFANGTKDTNATDGSQKPAGAIEKTIDFIQGVKKDARDTLKNISGSGPEEKKKSFY